MSNATEALQVYQLAKKRFDELRLLCAKLESEVSIAYDIPGNGVVDIDCWGRSNRNEQNYKQYMSLWKAKRNAINELRQAEFDLDLAYKEAILFAAVERFL